MIKEMLIDLGCVNVEDSLLGIHFEKSGFRYMLFHYTNEGGKEVDYWTIGKKRFDDITELRYYIKCL